MRIKAEVFCKAGLCVYVCVKRVVGEMTDRVIKPANDGNQQHYRADQSLEASLTVKGPVCMCVCVCVCVCADC